MPLKTALPRDVVQRLTGLGDAMASASSDVVFAYLFGSMATGRLTPQSDVDIAVYHKSEADGHAVRLAVTRAVSRHLGTDAIDVVVLNVAPIAVVGRVLGSRQVLLDRDPFTRHRFESVQARMFQDFRLREHRMLADRQARG